MAPFLQTLTDFLTGMSLLCCGATVLFVVATALVLMVIFRASAQDEYSTIGGEFRDEIDRLSDDLLSKLSK